MIQRGAKQLARPSSAAKPKAAIEDKQGPSGNAGYLELGRKNQKQRTRDALVRVATDFIRRGKPVSVPEVADLAQVSRTTAYRYFPTSEMLAAQASVKAADVIETNQLREVAKGPGTPGEKLDFIVAGSDTMTTNHEAAFRALLRLSVEPRPAASEGWPRRPSFRREWLEAAILEVKPALGAKRFNRLTGALSLLCGIESIVVLQDICMMKPEDARETKRWAAQLLLRGALEQAASSRVEVNKPKPLPKTAPKKSRPSLKPV